jgi:hypothetical protein
MCPVRGVQREIDTGEKGTVYTVGSESIRTAERISRENVLFETLPLIEFSVEKSGIGDVGCSGLERQHFGKRQ